MNTLRDDCYRPKAPCLWPIVSKTACADYNPEATEGTPRAAMTFQTYILLFPLVLAIHNMDECGRHDEFARAYHSRLPGRLRSRAATLFGMTAVTVVVAGLSSLTFLLRSPGLLFLSKVAVCAFLLNAVGHCLLSIMRRHMLPGTLSALTLVLPYCVIALIILRARGEDSVTALLGYALLGAIILPPTALLFLYIGSLLASRRESGRTDDDA